ncbi:MAG: hypothetical protein ACT4OU_07280 [Hyphomicrobium sp.]
MIKAPPKAKGLGATSLSLLVRKLRPTPLIGMMTLKPLVVASTSTEPTT